MTRQFNEYLDVAQLFSLVLGASILIRGVELALRSNGPYLVFLAVGGAFMAVAWTRNFVRVFRRPLPQDFSIPAADLDVGDRIVTWFTLLIGAAVLASAFIKGLFAALSIAVIAVGLLLLVRLALGPRLAGGHVEAYVFPVISLLGPVRVFFFGIGATAVIRGLSGIEADAVGNGAATVLLVGIALSAAGILEQGMIARRARGRLPSADSEVLPALERLEATMARVEERLSVPPVAPPPPPSPSRHVVRPLWFIAVMSLILLALAGFIVWNRFDRNAVTAGPLVLAGLIVVLAVMGERVGNLTLAMGKIKASVSETVEQEPQESDNGGAPSAGLDTTQAAAIMSPSGEAVSETLAKAARGEADIVLLDTDQSRKLWRAPQPPVVGRPPVRTRTVTLNGPAADVSELLETLAPR